MTHAKLREAAEADDRLHSAIGKLRAHIAAILAGKRATTPPTNNPILDCINDLPAIVRELDAAELENEGAFEQYEDRATRLEAELSAARDKCEGLDADLRLAVAVAYKRGAREWAKLNYPSWIEWLKANEARTGGE